MRSSTMRSSCACAFCNSVLAWKSWRSARRLEARYSSSMPSTVAAMKGRIITPQPWNTLAADTPIFWAFAKVTLFVVLVLMEQAGKKPRCAW